jgi:hypothetical protein
VQHLLGHELAHHVLEEARELRLVCREIAAFCAVGAAELAELGKEGFERVGGGGGGGCILGGRR